MVEKLTFDEFAEEYTEENNHLCQCHNTTMPPCGFCEGYFLKDAYEEYLEEIEEEK